jgi:hypothetical protein
MASGDNLENSDRVEAAGLSILRLLRRAADTADQSKRQALDTAEKLAQEVRVAQDRIAQLEGRVATYRDYAERAELWLDKIHAELEQHLSGGGRTSRFD